MRLSMDEVRKQHDSIKKLYEQGLRGATASVEQVLDLFDTIEALQQENERLRAEVQKLAKALNEGRLVEVVRCKDCKHLNTVYLESHGIGICDLGECARYGCKPNDYCNYGEAAENGERNNPEAAVNPIAIGRVLYGVAERLGWW